MAPSSLLYSQMPPNRTRPLRLEREGRETAWGAGLWAACQGCQAAQTSIPASEETRKQLSQKGSQVHGDVTCLVQRQQFIYPGLSAHRLTPTWWPLMRPVSQWSHVLHASPAGGPSPQLLMSQSPPFLCDQWGVGASFVKLHLWYPLCPQNKGHTSPVVGLTPPVILLRPKACSERCPQAALFLLFILFKRFISGLEKGFFATLPEDLG